MVLGLLTAVIFARWSVNDWRPFEQWDSGIFLYVGEQLRQGATLYVDVWDNKPPLIFLLNELGLRLAGGSPSGVFFLEYVLTCLCFLLLWRSLAGLFRADLALFGAIFGLLLFHSLVAHPNLAEVAALPVQALSCALLIHALDRGFRRTDTCVQGCLAAILFWTRADSVGITLVYVCAFVWAVARDRQWSHALKPGAWFFLAAVVTSFITVYPFAERSSWHSVYFAAIGFNQRYAGLTSVYDKAHTVLWFLLLLGQNPSAILGVAGAISIVLVRPSVRALKGQVLWVALLWLVIDVSLAAVTGKRYGKNVVPWILPLSILATGLVDTLTEELDGIRSVRWRAVNALSTAAVLLAGLGSFAEWSASAKAPPEPDEQLIPVLRSLAGPGDRVLFWGGFTGRVVYRAGYPPGSRFFTSIPLMHERSLYLDLAPQVCADVRRNRPAVIVEKTGGSLPPMIAPPFASGGSGAGTWDTEGLLLEKSAIRSQYKLVWSDAALHVKIYLRHDSRAGSSRRQGDAVGGIVRR